MATVCIKLSGALGLNLNPINIWEEEEEEVCVYDTQGTIQVCVRVCINSVIIFYTLGPVLMKKESTSFTSCKLFITFPRLSYCWLFDLLWFNENESYDHATDMRRCVRTVRSEIRTFLLIFKYLFILSFFFLFFFVFVCTHKTPVLLSVSVCEFSPDIYLEDSTSLRPNLEGKKKKRDRGTSYMFVLLDRALFVRH